MRNRLKYYLKEFNLFFKEDFESDCNIVYSTEESRVKIKFFHKIIIFLVQFILSCLYEINIFYALV